MNCLYARSNSKFHLVLSDDNCPDFFTSVNLDEISSVPYSPTAILEEDDWFYINLSKTENTAEVATEDKISDPLELLSRQINTTLPTLKADQYKGVKYFVFEPSGKKWFLLQKVLSGSKIYGKKILTVSDQPKLIEKPVIIINEEPDALYNYETNTLYFKKLEKLNSIFSNINSLYREATKEEMDTFFQMEIISVDQQFTTNKIGMLNRKNIALILETYNSYDADVKKELHSYIDNLNLPKNGDGKYIIDNDKNLKNFIYALQERYYTTLATHEKRLAQAFVTTS